MNEIRKGMIDELTRAFYQVDEDEIDKFTEAILKSNNIFTYSCGREKLMLKAFAMRLFHLGFNVHVVGDVTIPSIRKGDLMIIVCGPGYVSTDIAMADIAKKSGACVVCMTANNEGEITGYCDHIINIQAQTMVVKSDEVKSRQPMGSVFEQVQLLVEEYIVVKLIEKLKLSENDMRKRHTNLE